MPGTKQRNWTRRLSFRIALLLTLVMVPLGLISVMQTRAVVERAQESAQASLLARTEAAASEDRRALQSARGVASGLALTILEFDRDGCVNTLARVVDQLSIVVFASYTLVDGQMECSSTGDRLNFSDNEGVMQRLAAGRPYVTVTPQGPISGQAVIIVGHPVLENGELVGYIFLSIPRTQMNLMLDQNSEADSFALSLHRMDGTLLAASSSIEAAGEFLPREIPLEYLRTHLGQTLRGTGGDNQERYYAVVPIFEETTFVVGSWRVDDLPEDTLRGQILIATAFPLLMWVLSVGVALYGMRQLVTKHVASLRSAMRRFALGDKNAVPLAMPDASVELQDAGRAFNRMGLLITEAEMRREEDLRDKEVLLREIHHRVKNNLQLIASMMNMQMRTASSEEVRGALGDLQTRVRALAVMHRWLYNTPTRSTVDLSELIQAIVTDITANLDRERGRRVKTDIDPIGLYPDQAVPVSMIVAETLTNALQHGGTDTGEPPSVDITLHRSETGEVVYTIRNDVADARPSRPVDGVGRQLITAFLRQLDGNIDVKREGGRHEITVSFPLQTDVG